MRSHLQDILARQRLTTLLQPVLDLQEGRITGYEALPRGPSASPLYGPDALVAAAAHHDVLAELDLACMLIAIRTFARLDLAGRLFLNVSPTSLLEARFNPDAVSTALDQAGLRRSQLAIVIRRAEDCSDVDFHALDHAVSALRAAAIEVAVDDFHQQAFSGQCRWAELKPFFVKAEMRFVTELGRDPNDLRGRRPARSHVVQSARSPVLAHGVESSRDLHVLKGLGIRYAQGGLIGCPSPVPVRLLPPEVEVCLGRRCAPNCH